MDFAVWFEKFQMAFVFEWGPKDGKSARPKVRIVTADFGLPDFPTSRLH